MLLATVVITSALAGPDRPPGERAERQLGEALFSELYAGPARPVNRRVSSSLRP